MDEREIARDKASRAADVSSQANQAKSDAGYCMIGVTDGPRRDLTVIELLDRMIEGLQHGGVMSHREGETKLSEAHDLVALRNALPNRMDPAAERAMRRLLNFRY